MASKQLTLPKMEPKTPEVVIRENLARAMIRYRGDIRAYYSKLLENIPPKPADDTVLQLRIYADKRHRSG